MAELSPEARKALAAVQTTWSFGGQQIAVSLDHFEQRDAAIFAAGIAFGATARQRQDAEYVKSVAANFRTVGLLDAANAFDTAVQQLLGAPHA